MSGYYAFNWRRYDHAVHPQTPSAIVEMGFLTNASDRRLMTTEPGRVAQGIVGGILAFLASEDLLQNLHFW
ncbi:N-acetylmuramoyl-L-alanine amidase [Patescibacteria group bacterium]|nr:N-acetylmuramoyl-L-alanine amidase [Patescibacteria group bacterium]